MAEDNDPDLDLAISLSLSQPCEVKTEDRDDWLDEFLARETFNEEVDLTAVETSYDDLDDKQLCQQAACPISTPTVYEVTHEYYELHDPTPSIFELFSEFDQIFFNSKLGSVSVDWSQKMTSCAGITYYKPMSKFCFIRLSRPILTLRPRKDLVETLLHEMIHAFLFIAEDNRDHTDHGPQFKFHQLRINSLAKSNITIFHSFYDEVKSLKKHWWRCQGSCRYREPFYGYVKRAVNRAPGKSDIWWRSHQDTCGGEFLKIRWPETSLKVHEKMPKKSAKIALKPGNSQEIDLKKRTGTIEHCFGTQSEPSSSQNGTMPPYSSGLVNPKMEIGSMTSPIEIRDSDDDPVSPPIQIKSEPTVSTSRPLFTPPSPPILVSSPDSPMCTSPPCRKDRATQSINRNNQNSFRFSPYKILSPIVQSAASEQPQVLQLQECLFCNGYFSIDSFDEHFTECVKCFPTD